MGKQTNTYTSFVDCVFWQLRRIGCRSIGIVGSFAPTEFGPEGKSRLPSIHSLHLSPKNYNRNHSMHIFVLHLGIYYVRKCKKRVTYLLLTSFTLKFKLCVFQCQPTFLGQGIFLQFFSSALLLILLHYVLNNIVRCSYYVIYKPINATKWDKNNRKLVHN